MNTVNRIGWNDRTEQDHAYPQILHLLGAFVSPVLVHGSATNDIITVDFKATFPPQ